MDTDIGELMERTHVLVDRQGPRALLHDDRVVVGISLPAAAGRRAECTVRH